MRLKQFFGKSRFKRMKTIESKSPKFTKLKADCHKNLNFLLIIKIFEKERHKVFIKAAKTLKSSFFIFYLAPNR